MALRKELRESGFKGMGMGMMGGRGMGMEGGRGHGPRGDHDMDSTPAASATTAQ
jgi:hypothetical protein